MVPDWLDITNGIAAVPLQVLGFGIAYWQIHKTKDAATKAKAAAERTEHKIGSNLLLVLLPQLMQAEINLEWAIAKGDREAAIHYLGSWRWQAGQARGHLNPDDDDSEAMLTMIQSSIAIAADTKLSLQDPTSDIFKRCRAVQKAIALVTGMVGELTAKHSVEGNRSNGNV